jgi:hypothetical protein
MLHCVCPKPPILGMLAFHQLAWWLRIPPGFDLLDGLSRVRVHVGRRYRDLDRPLGSVADLELERKKDGDAPRTWNAQGVSR